MSEKKFYWLKFRHDFFSSKRIKKLRSLAGGDTFTIIYLKMQLKALETDGVLEYTGLEKSFAEEVALDIDESPDNVGVTINYLLGCGLMEMIDENHIRLPFVVENTGSESSSAQRVRDFREKQKTLQCNTDVTECNNSVTQSKSKSKEIEKEIETDKEKEVALQGGGDTEGGYDNIPICFDTPMLSKSVKLSKADKCYIDSVYAYNNIKPMYTVSDALDECIMDWLRYKAESKKESYKPSGMKSLLTTITKNASLYGDDAVIDLINECSSNGYVGIIWEKISKKPRYEQSVPPKKDNDGWQ